MKKILNLSFIIIFISSSTLMASDYYWVGGTGMWSDYASHWATTSGGTTFHVTIPSPNDDVFFDANSFSASGDTVYILTQNVYCKTMDWSGAVNAPCLSSPGNNNISVYGSLLLNNSLKWDFYGSIDFLSDSANNMVNTYGIDMLTNLNIEFTGLGTWFLQNDLVLRLNQSSSIYIKNGELYLNGNNLICYLLSVYPTGGNTAKLSTGDAHITCTEFMTYDLMGTSIVDADSSIIDCSQLQSCCVGGDVYNDVNASVQIIISDAVFHNVVTATIAGQRNVFNKAIITGMNSTAGALSSFDTLIFSTPGQSISVGDTLSVNSCLLIQSDAGFPTSLESNTQGIISVAGGNVCTDFIYLKNIQAIGGAQFYAGDHSVDLGGNTGWNWTRCAPLISNVWPGDCNYDLVTDNFDLLNIGVSFGDTGYVRPAASLSYTAQPCQDWYYQFINAANVKHADCDGSGIVDANDSTAISLNYGLTHPARLIHLDVNNSIGTELDFLLPPVIVPGSAVSVPVTLGTNTYPVNNIYGIAFTVNYDPTFIQPGTMSVDYSSSWVENAGNNLHLEKDFPGAGKTDIAFTRIDHSDVSGYGIIATLNFIASPSANGPFNLSFSHVKVISHNEIEIPIQTGTSTTLVNIEETGNQIASTVFPNPMTKDAQVIFSNTNHETWYLSMKDLTGRILSEQQITSSNSFLIERKDLNSGVYFYVIKNNSGKNGFGKLIIE